MAIVGAFLAFIITVLFMFALRPVAVSIGLVDIPGGRKRHGAPVPVIGGIAMSIGIQISSILLEHPDFLSPLLLGIFLLVAVGTIDDRFDLPPNVRLIAQTCASLLVVFGSDLMVTYLGSPFFFEFPLGPASTLFTILFILTVVNAFNVIDGIDGLAGGLAFLALGATAIIGFGTDVFGLSCILLAAVAAFLIFNAPIRKIRPLRAFMGDAGSTFLGLSIAAIGIALCQGPVPLMSPVVGLWFVAIPVFDLFSAVMRRLLSGKSPFVSDHEHLHHMLMVNGLSPRATLLFVLAVAALCAAFGIAGDAFVLPDGLMLLLWLTVGLAYYQMLRYPRQVAHVLEAMGATRRTASNLNS